MRFLTLVLTLSLLLVQQHPVVAETSWIGVAKRLYSATARVTISFPDGTGTCTAFSINTKERYFMTAAHCAGEVMTVDNHIAWPVYYNEELDLMVLHAPGVKRPALQPSRRTVVRGLPMAAFGFADAFSEPSLHLGVVQIPNLRLDLRLNDGTIITGQRWVMSDFSYIGGMSGGAVVDQDGRVISVVQLGNDQVGLGRTLEVIMAATAQFWG